MYSNPPLYGARIVSEILSDPVLKKKWASECKGRGLELGVRGLGLGIASEILSDPVLKKQWAIECKGRGLELGVRVRGLG
jgi:aspartate/tyrosine/aromatic aminotransferase